MKNKGRIIGALLLLTTIIGVSSLNMRGLSASMLESPDFLQNVFDSSNQMKIAVLLDLLANIIGFGVAVILFPVLRQYHKGVALGYLGFWIVQLAIIIFSNISHLSLLSVSQHFVSNGAEGVAYFNAVGIVQVESYFWAHFLSLLVYSIGAMMLYYTFYISRLIPRWLSAWGIVAVSIVFVTTIFQIFDYSIDMLLYMQNGIFMLVLIIWLLVKGFAQPADTSD